MNLLVPAVLALELYQFAAHLHATAGRALPPSHRTRRGFGAALLLDAAAYGLVLLALVPRDGPPALVFAAGLVLHLAYSALYASPAAYARVHDIRHPSIYGDRQIVWVKRVFAGLDTALHAAAAVALARHAAPGLVVPAVLVGAAAYLAVWAARPSDGRVAPPDAA